MRLQDWQQAAAQGHYNLFFPNMPFRVFLSYQHIDEDGFNRTWFEMICCLGGQVSFWFFFVFLNEVAHNCQRLLAVLSLGHYIKNDIANDGYGLILFSSQSTWFLLQWMGMFFKSSRPKHWVMREISPLGFFLLNIIVRVHYTVYFAMHRYLF